MKNNRQWSRHVIIASVGLLLAWGLFQGFRPQPVEVDTRTASRSTMQVKIEQEGRTRVVDRYVVSSPVNGYARRIGFDVGDVVEHGTVLVQLEPLRADVIDARHRAEAVARIAAANANLKSAQQLEDAAASSARLAEKEYQRFRTLNSKGFISAAAEDRASSEAEQKYAELRSAHFAVATAKHELEATKTALKYAASGSMSNLVTILAPVSGQVLKIPRKSEGTVSAGQPLIEIGDPLTLEVEVDVLSADAVRILPGTRVLLERWGGEGNLEGVVRLIEPTGFTKVSALGVEEQRVWVIVAFTSPRERWQRLGDGYRVEANFILWEANDILQIPASAIFRGDSGWETFVIENNKAVRRRVDIGQRNGLSAQVISGIYAGERVIVHPDDRVKDGIRVTSK